MADEEPVPAEVRALEAPERVGWMPPQTVIDLLDPHPGIRCLDLGAGTGYMARPLASHVAPGGVVCLDRSRSMLEELGRRAREAGVWVARVQGLSEGLPFREGAFGRILAVELLHEVEDREAVLAEMHRVLEPGGRVVVVGWADGDGPPGPPAEARVGEEQAVSGLEAEGFVGGGRHDVLDRHWVVTAQAPD